MRRPRPTRRQVAGVALAVALLAGCARAPAPLAGPLTRLPSPAGPGAMAPDLATSADGVWLTWLEPLVPGSKEAWALRAARLQGEVWEPSRTIASGDGFFANWADFPGLTAAGGELVAQRLRRLGEATYAYGIELSRSTDGGASWEDRGLVHDDASPTEHGFASLVAGDRAVHAVWLDGRATLDGGAMQLRAAALDAGTPSPSVVLDESVCDCCQTDAAWTDRGLAVVYRDRDGDEVRDIAIVRGEGDVWSAPQPVHADGWRILGCPVNGPAIDTDGERLAVAWYTAADDRPRVLLAFSDDAGDSFDPPIEVDAEAPAGRVDVVLTTSGAVVSWLAGAGDAGEVLLRRVGRDGRAGPPIRIAATSTERSSGFPRMVRDGDRLVVAWVEATTPSAVRLAALAPAG